jgi:LuxR family transcriptional regulator, transcriptional regulator of spore coat protein
VTGPRPLTNRQRQVLALVANGNTNQQIARWLGRSPDTINKTLHLAYQTLGATDRAQAVAIALAIGELGVHEIHIPDQQREAAA